MQAILQNTANDLIILFSVFRQRYIKTLQHTSLEEWNLTIMIQLNYTDVLE